ncbi:MAG: hypothetical protein U0103_01835 [Candidatus Obscuribacterales bacterium]|nr:hypothetical protein [Cyanobacteria bacterium SZAS LIN-5]
MTTVVNNSGTAPVVRKVLLSGGGNNGRIWDASYDHLYVIEVAPALGSAALPEGSFSVNNAVIRPLRYNATGKYEAVGAENLEIYEFVGFESMLVIERPSLSSLDVLRSESGIAVVNEDQVVVRK